jgi:hypothetical protein
MIALIQLVFALMIVSLENGPASHYLADSWVKFDLLIVSSWAFAWFGSRQISFRWALMVGLLLDVASFLPFGVWTLLLLAIVSGEHYLRSSYLNASSLGHSIIGLLYAELIMAIFVYIAGGSIFSLSQIGGLVFDVVLAGIVYYVLAIQFHFLQRWFGGQI